MASKGSARLAPSLCSGTLIVTTFYVPLVLFCGTTKDYFLLIYNYFILYECSSLYCCVFVFLGKSMHLLSPSSDSLWSWSDRKRSVFRRAKDLFRFHTAICQALGERAGCNLKRVKPNCWLQVLRKVVLQRGLGGDGQMVIDTNTRRTDVSREGGFRYCCSQWGGERPAGPTRGRVVFKDWVKTCFGEGLASEGWCLGAATLSSVMESLLRFYPGQVLTPENKWRWGISCSILSLPQRGDFWTLVSKERVKSERGRTGSTFSFKWELAWGDRTKFTSNLSLPCVPFVVW